MFCALGLIFGDKEGVGSSFHVLGIQTHFWRYRGRRFSFHVLCYRTYFQWCRGRRASFSCFVPRATGPGFMFCAPRLVLGGTEGVRYSFMFCSSGLVFGGTESVGSSFSYFPLPNSFWAVPRAPALIFMFCAPRLIFRGTEDVGSRFHVLRSRSRFGRYRRRRVQLQCFALPVRIWAVQTAPSLVFMILTILRVSVPVFMFCAPGLVFGGTMVVRSSFHILCS
jgi:hypothetical protein